MAQIVPITNDPDQDQKVLLGDTEFIIVFSYNVRGEFWTISLLDSGRDPIVTGVKAVVKYSLFSRYKDIRLPEGNLYLIDTSGDDIDPNLDDLGTRVLLAYDG